MAQQSRRHHFVPQFFSKLWAGPDGRVCEYSRPHRALVMRRKFPKAIGFDPDLYRLPGAVPEDASFIEDRFFAAGDQRACNALNTILAGDAAGLSFDLRSAFTRFLISLHHRTPERIAALRLGLLREVDNRAQQAIAAGTNPPFPTEPDLDRFRSEWQREVDQFSWGPLLMQLVDSDLVGPAIYNMLWATRRLGRSEHDLLTGDHPLILSNGIGRPEGHVALPLGPRVLFLATNNVKVQAAILSQTDNRIVRDANRETLRNACRFIYATGEQHAAFVDSRLRRA